MSAQSATPPDHRPPRPGPSFFAPDLHVTGRIVSTGDLEIEGEVDGIVDATRLKVGPHGRLRASIEADDAVVSGNVAGIIKARGVTFTDGCRFSGEVQYEQLGMEPDATVEGRLIPVVDGNARSHVGQTVRTATALSSDATAAATSTRKTGRAKPRPVPRIPRHAAAVEPAPPRHHPWITTAVITLVLIASAVIGALYISPAARDWRSAMVEAVRDSKPPAPAANVPGPVAEPVAPEPPAAAPPQPMEAAPPPKPTAPAEPVSPTPPAVRAVAPAEPVNPPEPVRPAKPDGPAPSAPAPSAPAPSAPAPSAPAAPAPAAPAPAAEPVETPPPVEAAPEVRQVVPPRPDTVPPPQPAAPPKAADPLPDPPRATEPAKKAPAAAPAVEAPKAQTPKAPAPKAPTPAAVAEPPAVEPPVAPPRDVRPIPNTKPVAVPAAGPTAPAATKPPSNGTEGTPSGPDAKVEEDGCRWVKQCDAGQPDRCVSVRRCGE